MIHVSDGWQSITSPALTIEATPDGKPLTIVLSCPRGPRFSLIRLWRLNVVSISSREAAEGPQLYIRWLVFVGFRYECFYNTVILFAVSLLQLQSAEVWEKSQFFKPSWSKLANVKTTFRKIFDELRWWWRLCDWGISSKIRIVIWSNNIVLNKSKFQAVFEWI